MRNRIALCIEKSGPLELDAAPSVTCRAYTSETQRDEATLEIMEAFNQSIAADRSRAYFCKITYGQNSRQGDFIPDMVGNPVAHFVDGKWIVAKLGLPRTLSTRFEISDAAHFGSTALSPEVDKFPSRFFSSLSDAVNCIVKFYSPDNLHKFSIVDRFTGARFWMEAAHNQFKLVADSAFAKEVLRDALNSQRADYLIGQAANVISQIQDSNSSDDAHQLIVDILDYLGNGSHNPQQDFSVRTGG